MTPAMSLLPVDRNGTPVRVGSMVRVVSLSGEWFEKLPDDEKCAVQSMIGEVFAVEEIDEYGRPWVEKWWYEDDENHCRSHSVALEPHEMECAVP